MCVFLRSPTTLNMIAYFLFWKALLNYYCRLRGKKKKLLHWEVSEKRNISAQQEKTEQGNIKTSSTQIPSTLKAITVNTGGKSLSSHNSYCHDLQWSIQEDILLFTALQTLVIPYQEMKDITSPSAPLPPHLPEPAGERHKTKPSC